MDFDSIYREHRSMVLRLARAIVGNDHEDVAQDVWLIVHLKLDSFRGESSFRSWIYRITANACFDHLRRSRVRSGFLVYENQLEFFEQASFEQSIEQALMDRQLLGKVNDLLEPWEVAYFSERADGASSISLLQGEPEGTMKSRISRTRRRVSDAIARRSLWRHNWQLQRLSREALENSTTCAT